MSKSGHATGQFNLELGGVVSDLQVVEEREETEAQKHRDPRKDKYPI